MIVGVGQHFHQRDGRTRQCTDHDASENQHQYIAAAAQGPRNYYDDEDRDQAAGESHQLDRRHREAEQDSGDGTEPRASGHAENVWRHQRITEQALIGGAGRGERGADDAGSGYARKPNIEDDGFDRAVVSAAEQSLDESARHLWR